MILSMAEQAGMETLSPDTARPFQEQPSDASPACLRRTEASDFEYGRGRFDYGSELPAASTTFSYSWAHEVRSLVSSEHVGSGNASGELQAFLRREIREIMRDQRHQLTRGKLGAAPPRPPPGASHEASAIDSRDLCHCTRVTRKHTRWTRHVGVRLFDA